MNLSDYTLKFLEKKKVKKVFLITGGAIAFMIDAFSRNKKIKYISAAHEQSAAMMADAYSRLGPNFSCTMVTSGPGATNLITGIACSYFDSIPSLHICGQVNTYEQQDGHKSTKNVRQVGFQETDIVNIAKPITKYAYKIKDASEIRYVLEKAYHLATTGRPGPVLIDIPMDLQRVKIDPKKLKSFKPSINKKIIKYRNIVAKIENLLRKSKKPVIILGGGIKYGKAELDLINFLKIFNIPIVTTWSGVDLIDHNNKNYIGNIGVYGSRAANFTVQNSDLILCLGSRLDTRVTGGVPKSFARNAKKIVVDIDKYELGKKRGLKIDLKVELDIKIFFQEYEKYKKINIIKEEWLLRCYNWKIQYPIILKKFYDEKNLVWFKSLPKNPNTSSFKEVLIRYDEIKLKTFCLTGRKK